MSKREEPYQNGFYAPGVSCCTHPHANLPRSAQVGLPRYDASLEDLAIGAALESMAHDRTFSMRAVTAALNKATRNSSKGDPVRARERARQWRQDNPYRRTDRPKPVLSEAGRANMRAAQERRRAKERAEAGR